MSSLESHRPILAYASRQYPITIASIAGVICRFVINNGAPLMIVQDLLRVLGYKDNRTSDLRKIFDTNQRIHHRNFDEIVIKLPFGRWGITTINEDGLRLACNLVKPERTQGLRRWLEEGGMQHIADQAHPQASQPESPTLKTAAAAVKCGVNAAFDSETKFIDVNEFAAPLQPGDHIRSIHAHRAGLVVRVYDDGSAAVHWDDAEPQPFGFAHERMPRRLLELVKRPDPGAARTRRKEYCRELCKIIVRYADDTESLELARALEGVSASILARRYCPGLNAAAYDVFAHFGMKGGE